MITHSDELRTLGNPALLLLPKTVFLCSREYPADIEHDSYLWAMEQRQLKNCVASGFQSQLEYSIFRFLRQDLEQPIVYALARGIQPGVRFEYERDLHLGRLLFASSFEPEVTTTSEDTITIRNLLLADVADSFFIPYISAGGRLERLMNNDIVKGKPLLTLDVPGNVARQLPQAQFYQPAGLLGGARTNS